MPRPAVPGIHCQDRRQGDRRRLSKYWSGGFLDAGTLRTATAKRPNQNGSQVATRRSAGHHGTHAIRPRQASPSVFQMVFCEPSAITVLSRRKRHLATLNLSLYQERERIRAQQPRGFAEGVLCSRLPENMPVHMRSAFSAAILLLCATAAAQTTTSAPSTTAAAPAITAVSDCHAHSTVQ